MSSVVNYAYFLHGILCPLAKKVIPKKTMSKQLQSKDLKHAKTYLQRQSSLNDCALCSAFSKGRSYVSCIGYWWCTPHTVLFSYYAR